MDEPCRPVEDTHHVELPRIKTTTAAALSTCDACLSQEIDEHGGGLHLQAGLESLSAVGSATGGDTF